MQKNIWNEIKKISVLIKYDTIMFARSRNTCIKSARISSSLCGKIVKAGEHLLIVTKCTKFLREIWKKTKIL